MAKQIADWGPSMDRLALISGGGAGGGRVESRPRLPWDTDTAGLAQREKAIRYLQGPKGVGDTLATLSQGQKELSEKLTIFLIISRIVILRVP